jgi:hypothetical protein
MIPQFVLLFTLLVVYCYQQADKLARRILAKRPNEPESLDACARAAYYLGNAVRYAGANTKAHQLFKEAVAWSKTLHEASGGDDEGQRALRCDYLEALGEASLKLDGFVDAASAFAEALLVAQGLTDDGVASLEEWPAGRVACKLAAAQVDKLLEAAAAEGSKAEAEAEAAKEAIQQALRTLEPGWGRRSVAGMLRGLRAMLAETLFLLAEEVVEEVVTWLYIAAQEGHLPVVKLLLDRGADVNPAMTNEGYTPLLIAAREGHLPVVQLLLDRGADGSQANDDGNTPLLIATQQGHLPVVQLLLDRGADVNEANTYGLLVAAQHGHLPVVQLLLDRGANVEAYHPCIGDAYEMATSLGHAAVAELIAASEEAHALAEQGYAEPFRAQIEAAELGAPMAQWVPALPAAERTALLTWARAAVQDAEVCYAVFYADLDLVPPPPPQALGHEWRGILGHDGVVGIRRLIVSFLVHPKAGTRRALCELAAMGDLGAAAGAVQLRREMIDEKRRYEIKLFGLRLKNAELGSGGFYPRPSGGSFSSDIQPMIEFGP